MLFFGIQTFLDITIVLFALGILAMFLMRHSIIIILMNIEMILLSVSVAFISFSCYLDDALGFVTSLFILTIAAAESSIGLAIFVSYYRLRGGIGVDLVSLLKS